MTQKDLKLSIKISVDDSGLVKLDKSVTNQVNKTKELEAATERLKVVKDTLIAAETKASDAYKKAQDIATKATQQVNQGIINQGLALYNTEKAANKYREALVGVKSAETAYQAEANKTIQILNEIKRLKTAISATPVSYINAEGDKAGRDPFDATKVRTVVKPTGMFNYATGAISSGLSATEKLNQQEIKAQAALRALLNKRNNQLKRDNEELKALEDQRLADFNLVEAKLKEASARRVKLEQEREKAIQANLQASIARQREINAAYVAQSVKSLTTPDESGRAAELASLRSSIQAKYERLAEEEKAQEELRKKTIASNLAAYKQQTSDAVNELNNRVNLEASIRRFGADSQQTIALKAAIEEQRIRKELAANIAIIEKDVASGSITNAEARSKTRTATTLATTALIENSKALDENNKVVDRSKQQHKSLLTHITEVYGAYQLLNTGLNLVKQGLLGIPQAGIALEQATSSLSAVLGSQGATATLKDLRMLADSAGQSFTTLTEAYTRFAPSAMLAGAQQEEVNQVFEDFTKASTVLHLTTSEVKSLYLALEQMYAKSTVQSEEIKKQLGNVLPGAVEVGAKAMNMNVAEFMKAMSKNLIAAKDFVPKFAEAYRKMFGGVDDSVFNDARTKLLSNLQRIKNEYFYISADLYQISAETLNTFVRFAANSLTTVRENLQGILQVVTAISTIIGANLAASIAKFATSAQGLAAIGGLAARIFTPVTAIATAATAAYGGLITTFTDTQLKYEKFTNANKDYINELMRTYAAQKEGAQQAGEELERLTEKSKSLSFNADNIQLDLTSVLQASWDVYTEWLNKRWSQNIEWVKSIFISLGETIAEALGETVTEYIAKITASLANATVGILELIKPATDEISGYISESLNKVIERAKVIQAQANRELEGNKGPNIPPPSLPAGAESTVDNAKETARLAKEAYRAAFEEIKASYNEILGDIADASTKVDNLYNQNILSISSYFSQKEQLQKTDLAVQQEMVQAELSLANSKQDKVKVAKLENELVKITNKASQDAIKLSQEKYNAELKYKNLLESTQVAYLNSVNMTAKAAQISFDMQNRERLSSLQAAYAKGEAGSGEALSQFNVERQNTLLKANFDEAQKYRDALNSIDDGWRQIGATSSDVLSASLGGFSPLFNLFDNFTNKQNELIQKLEDVKAEAERLKGVQIVPGDTEAEAKLFKDREVNQKQINLIEAESAANRIKLARESFSVVTSMFKEGTKARKIAHVAEMAFNVAEKFGILAKLPLLGAEAMLTQGKGDPYSAFARIAAMGALVASIIAAVGGNGAPSVKDTTMPESTGQGTTYGDKTTESTSITDSLGYLADINLKSYGELKKINANLESTTTSIASLVLSSSKGLALNKLDLTKLTAVSPERNKNISNLLSGGSMLLSGGGFGLAAAGAASMAGLTGAAFMGTVMAGIMTGILPGLIMMALSFIPGVGKVISSVINFFIDGLFGKVTKEVTAQGVLTSPMMAGRIVKGQKAIVSQYTTIKEKTESWFDTSIKYYDVLTKATESSVSTFTNIYSYMINIMKGFAADLTTAEYDKVLLYTFSKIKINLMKQDPAKVTEKLKQVLSAELDKYAKFVFGDIYDIYQDLKEGMFTTLTRVSKEAAFTKFSFAKLGIATPTVQTDLVAVSEALINAGSSAETAADRFKDFQKSVDNFYSNFSTEAKKNLDSLDNFTQSLLAIFAENVKTVAGSSFKSLNEAFFTTLQTTGDLYASVRAMNEAIDVTAMGAQNAVTAILSLDPAIAKLVSTITQPITEQITALQDTIDNFTAEDLITKLQSEKDLNTQKTLASKATKLIVEKYNVEANAIKSTKSALKDLGNVVKNLLLGDLSTLDPTEKYKEAEKQYLDLLAQLNGSDVVKASEAAGKIGSAAQTYLQEAKSYFSSTTQYADIFKSVTDTLSKLSEINTTGEEAIVAATENLATEAIKRLNDLYNTFTATLSDTIKQNMVQLTPAAKTEPTTPLTGIFEKIVAASQTKSTVDDALANALLNAYKTPGKLTDADIITKQAAALKTKSTADDYVMKMLSQAYTKDPAKANYLLEVERQLILAEQDSLTARLADAKAKKDTNLTNALNVQIADNKEKLAVLGKEIKYKASGGSTSGLTLVGEQGPELLQLPYGSSIMSNPSTNRYINANSKASTDLLKEIKVELVTLNGRMETIERKTRLGAKV